MRRTGEDAQLGERAARRAGIGRGGSQESGQLESGWPREQAAGRVGGWRAGSPESGQLGERAGRRAGGQESGRLESGQPRELAAGRAGIERAAVCCHWLFAERPAEGKPQTTRSLSVSESLICIVCGHIGY